MAANKPEIGEEEINKTECYSDWDLPIAFSKKRHTETIEGIDTVAQTWRMKERMKTVSVALVICLNVGVDPPDIVKTHPCARLECWIDPLSMSPQKAMEAIGSNLQKQYERWQPRARYKQSLDPTVEEVKKLCTSLRRNAKEERVLFHYNGHGVPKPTTNGEIWVFNRLYTQYIPLSIYDLQTWMGAPSIYVYDCSNAGIIIDLFKQFAEQHEKDYEQLNAQTRNGTPPPPNYKNCIQLAACSSDQILPMNPDLPADIFTSCLTTPIKIALRWFVIQNNGRLLPSKVTMESIDKIPGQLSDRRTMLGELNWIFTAITDTIAWNTLPRDLFQKLFRQDLLVASLFRNFLLAERIMRSYDCTPVSCPALPQTYQHSMWSSWDLALDMCLAQLPDVLESEDNFKNSKFFEHQLTAFEVWLKFGSEKRSPPEQLPIVLQVLLSQVHRLRALDLLGKFLDLGPWAVNLALSVGIFPYVLKLLQSSAKELRPLLVFIWAKILAVDSSCQADLVRDNGHKYFLSVLQDTAMSSDDRTLAAFVLACMVDNYPCGQEAALQGSLVSTCLIQLNDSSPLLRQWLAITLGRLWRSYDKARWCGVRDSAHEKLYVLLTDPSPEVRAASVFALGTFISSVTERCEHANNIDHNVAMTLLSTVSKDMSPLVRKELIVALQHMVMVFENSFLSVALQEIRDGGQVFGTGSLRRTITHDTDRLRKLLSPSSNTLFNNYNTVTGIGDVYHEAVSGIKRVASSSSIATLTGGAAAVADGCPLPPPLPPPKAVPPQFGTVYQKVWVGLSALERDPYPGVACLASALVLHVRDQVRETVATRDVHEAKASSLPPSPSNKSNYLNCDSPPTSSSADKLSISRTVPLTPRTKKPVHTTISEDAVEEANGSGGSSGRKSIVSTQFIEWSCKYFAQSITTDEDLIDKESPLHYQREWRFLRNSKLRKEAAEECARLSTSRLENQMFHTRCSFQPNCVKFHPYESQIAITYKDTLTVWDYQSSNKIVSIRGDKPAGTSGSISSSYRKVNCIEYINSHDITLVATGTDDGAIKIWRLNGALLTAWHAMPVTAPSLHHVSKQLYSYSSSGNGGVGVMAWDQVRQTMIVGGDHRVLRIWDTETELLLQDIPTDADSCVTCISLDPIKGGPMMCIGCGDGTVRLFDRRLKPPDTRVATFREHSSWIVNAKLGLGGNSIISGSTTGDVRLFDTRAKTSSLAYQTSQGQGLRAMDAHPGADIFACGSVNQISINRWSGTQLNVIKSVYHEWFYTSKFGPVGCLSFHPYKVLLAAGSADSTLSIYSLDNKR
ncbi:hypothetical protein O3M35_002064 [Rhynocoris fuscipes]|uniref:Raptor N-terminal CASPase-like domain-containing protein n=1 Tax=Rhynocoris fuscipes TaxID=488301 RepID=A0AAW1CPQ9_9HEMI